MQKEITCFAVRPINNVPLYDAEAYLEIVLKKIVNKKQGPSDSYR